MSFNLSPQQLVHQKQSQLLMMQPKMQQALEFLQAPVMELSALIEHELEQNPLLEQELEIEWEGEQEKSEEEEVKIDDEDFSLLQQMAEDLDYSQSDKEYATSEQKKKREFWENSLPAKESIFSRLMEQAKQTFETKEELVCAEWIIGNLDESGYFAEEAVCLNVDEKVFQSVLKAIQMFEPYGIGARDRRESLLIQLRCLKKEKTLAYAIIEKHYDDLLHNRMPAIQRALKRSHDQIRKEVDEHILPLSFHPGIEEKDSRFDTIIPDVIIREEEGELIVSLADESTPQLFFNKKYLKLLKDPSHSDEVKEYVKKHVISAKWLVKNIYQRNETLTRIANFLAVKQKEHFLHPDGKLSPLTMREVAEKLEVHESTIARAVAGKYLDTPRGFVPMRSLFTNTYTTAEGEDISGQTVKQAIQRLIDSEEKKKPLSDQQLSEHLKEQGIPCARRTVAKHRVSLGIGTALQRRRYS